MKEKSLGGGCQSEIPGEEEAKKKITGMRGRYMRREVISYY